MKFIRLRKDGQPFLVNTERLLCVGNNVITPKQYRSATFSGIPTVWHNWDDPVEYIFSFLDKKTFIPLHRLGGTFFVNTKFIKSIGKPMSSQDGSQSILLIEQDWLHWDESMADIEKLLTERGKL